MALSQTQVSQLYVAVFNRASEGEGNSYWQDQGLSAAESANAMLALDAAQEYFGDALDSDQAFIEHIYANTLNKTVDQDPEGIAYWVGLLEEGMSRGEVVASLVEAAANFEDTEDQAYQQFANRVEVSNYTADNLQNAPDNFQTALQFGQGLDVTADADTVAAAKATIDGIEDVAPEEPGVPGETISLTDGRDNLVGTENDDTFDGLVGQNQNGAIANAFSTGDRLDGGEGRDKVVASMINDNEVEGLTNSAPRPITQNIEEVYIEALESVTLDATRMENVEQYWADFGRGDMTFENVSLQGGNLSITKDVTFGIRDTQFGTNFTAEFDSQSLTREAASQVNSSLLVRIADVSTETPTTPLANVDLNLSFDLGGETVTLEGIRSTDGTYPGLALALRNALEEAGYGDVNVNLSTPYDQVTVAGNTVNLPFTAQEILLTDPAGNAFSNVNFTQSAIEPVADGFLVAGNADPVDPSVTSSLIESNLVLDNAGRGSIAGDVVIGGGSNSELGVEQFNVLVDRSSKIESLNTTSEKLQNIVISSIGAAGSLYIGSTQDALAEIDANAFEGAELSLGETVNGFGSAVVNLANLDAAGTSADVTFVADYDGAGRASDAQSFVINTGSGDDTITADLTGTSTSNSTTASLTVNAGAGNNVITLTSTDVEVNEATVVTAGGADTVTGGATHLTAETGAGNDTIYAENTGSKAVAQLDEEDVFFTTTTTSGNTTDIRLAQLLNGREVQVTLELPGVNAVDSFTSGLETTVQVQASNGVLTTERDLYEAVANGINSDPVLSKLAKASVDSNGNLVVEYSVDGVTAEGNDLVQIELLGEWDDLQSTPRNALLDALRQENSDSTIDAADLATLFNNSAVDGSAPVSAVAQQVADTAVAAVFTVDLAGLTATATAGGEITFIIDGQQVTLTEGVAADFEGQSTADALANELATSASPITIDGVAYTIAQVGTTSEITLTQVVPTEVSGGITVQSTEGGVQTVNGTQTTIGADTTLGTNSTTDGVNSVNAGAGDDVIVLSSNDSTTDTVVFDAGQFGNDTIVHFNDGVGGDVLDFSAWLNNQVQVGGSNSAESRADAATALVTSPGAISANDVTVVNFNDFTFGTGVTFDNVTNGQMLASLNEAGGFTVASTTDLVGTTQNSILLVQNFDSTEGNQGEYKVFQVASTNTAGEEFTSATLVGSIDFGAEQNFDISNFA